MEGGGATLGAAYPGRFVLGIGISHGPIVEMSGQVYAKPMETMLDYLDGMDASIAYAPVPEVPVPRVLAALRPKMLELARTAAMAHTRTWCQRRTRRWPVPHWAPTSS